MKAVSAAILFFLLTACATPQPVITDVREVPVPVKQPCIEKADIPALPLFPLDAVDLTDPKFPLTRLANAAREELSVRRKWVDEVYKIFNACTK